MPLNKNIQSGMKRNSENSSEMNKNIPNLSLGGKMPAKQADRGM